LTSGEVDWIDMKKYKYPSCSYLIFFWKHHVDENNLNEIKTKYRDQAKIDPNKLVEDFTFDEIKLCKKFNLADQYAIAFTKFIKTLEESYTKISNAKKPIKFDIKMPPLIIDHEKPSNDDCNIL